MPKPMKRKMTKDCHGCYNNDKHVVDVTTMTEGHGYYNNDRRTPWVSKQRREHGCKNNDRAPDVKATVEK